MSWPSNIPEATVRRLSKYLAALRRVERDGVETVSSVEIAKQGNANAAQVRKDLSYFGDFGYRGVGYKVGELRAELMRILGVDVERRAVVIGAGNLGAALIGYPGFERRGFRIVGLFDNNQSKIGHRVSGERVLGMAQLGAVVAKQDVEIAVVAVPAVAAQQVVDALVAAGVRSILNLAPIETTAPPPVIVRSVDMTAELEVLAFCLADADKPLEGERS